MLKRISIILTYLLAIIMCAFCCACNFSDANDDENSSQESGYHKGEIISDEFIVNNNQSNYIIAIPTEYSSTEYFAATEIQSFFEQSTGAKLPIKIDISIQDDFANKIISIGATSFFKKKNIKTSYSSFKGDAFILKTEGLSIYVYGANDRGTLYGSYELLEQLLGVKFLAVDYTYVPTNNNVNLFSFNGKVFAPAFNIRMFLTNDMYNDSLFLARMRMGSELVNADEKYGGKIKWDTTTPHTTLYYVSTSKYFDLNTSQPKDEYKHMYTIEPDENGNYDICMTDGITDDGKIDNTMEVSAFKCALEKLKENVRNADKDCNFFIFSQMDRTTACTCDRCVAQREIYKDSGINVRFANLLAEEINKWAKEEYGEDRKINLVIFAYQYSMDAPVNSDGSVIDKSCIPNEYVYVRFASINNDQYYAFNDSSEFAVQLKYWQKLTSNIMIWTYHTRYTGFLWPFPTIQTMNTNLSLFKEYGAEYVLMQANHVGAHDWQDKINTYVASKLLWDPSRSAMELREEFIDLYYGIASEDVRNLLGILEEKMIEVAEDGGNVGLIYEDSVFSSDFYSIGFLENLVSIINNAIQKVENSNIENKEDLILRLKEVKLTPLYMLVKNCSSYYVGNTVELQNVVRTFCDLCDEVGYGALKENGENTNTLRSDYAVSE